jgi:integrase
MNNYRKAKLHRPKTGNDWYVYYSILEDGQWKQKKERKGFSKMRTISEKIDFGTTLANNINEHLEAGAVSLSKEKIELDKKKQDFLWWYEEVLNYAKVKFSYNTYVTVNICYSRLKKYKKEIKVSEVTHKFLEDYEAHLLKTCTTNTAANHLTRLRVVVNKLIKAGELEYHKNPFINFKIKKARSSKPRLGPQEIAALETATNLSEIEEVARDMFLFSYYCAGMRFTDLCLLTRANVKDGYLEYIMHKTKKPRKVLLIEPALNILKKYNQLGFIFPTKIDFDTKNPATIHKSIKSRNGILNIALQRVCKKIGITPVSFHSTRKSVADRAIALNTNMHTLKDLLGHSSVAITEIYTQDSYPERSDDAMRNIYDNKKAG